MRVASPTREQWRKFRDLILEPWTLILVVVSVALFAIGQSGLSGSVNAVVQILLATASGVLGARVTNLIAESSGQGVLSARGKVAVRGLKLMLVQTAAFEQRLRKFLANRAHICTNPEVTERNYEEAIEFCKRIQEEATSAMETWGDIVPTADFSTLIGRITEADELREAAVAELREAQVKLEQAAEGAAERQRLQDQVKILTTQVELADRRVSVLQKRLTRQGVGASGRPPTYEEWKLEKERKVREAQTKTEVQRALDEVSARLRQLNSAVGEPPRDD
jgi:hypothetical protein